MSLPTLAIVCQDTGAANALSAYVAAGAGDLFDVRVVTLGLARAVFHEAGIQAEHELEHDPPSAAIEALFEGLAPDAVLQGTSFECWTERRFCALARQRGVFSIGVVDWWSNFKARFSTPGQADLGFLPDAIALPDEDARAGCLDEGIAPDLLHVTGNPYWDLLGDRGPRLAAARERVRARLGLAPDARLGLLVSSNIRNLGLNLGYDEADFFACVRPLPGRTGRGAPVSWFVKPHPKERPAELRAMLSRLGMSLPFLENVSGLEALAAADFVVGMCSSALFEAALLGRAVASVQPGVRPDKLRSLKIFERLALPRVGEAGGASALVQALVSESELPARPGQLPPPLADGRAGSRISRLLLAGLGGRAPGKRSRTS